jgi:hypothetical protein
MLAVHYPPVFEAPSLVVGRLGVEMAQQTASPVLKWRSIFLFFI